MVNLFESYDDARTYEHQICLIVILTQLAKTPQLYSSILQNFIFRACKGYNTEH